MPNLVQFSVHEPDPALLAWFRGEVPDWREAVLPAYGGGSIANLPSSILASFDAPPERFEGMLPPVDAGILPAELLGDARVVVLIVIDGLGAHALADASRRGEVPGLMSAGWQSCLTSVFPSSTAAATVTPISLFAPDAELVVATSLVSSQ